MHPQGEAMRFIPHNRFSHREDPFVIQPYYTGRDKGPITTKDETGYGVLTFFNEGRAWKYIFDHLQPNDERACDNYRVIRASEL
jgi:hypothetical protein